MRPYSNDKINMLRKLFLTAYLLFLVLVIQAQIPDDFIRIDVSEIEGAKILQERTFTKESLFGYMNGGAELYLEYGFDRLVVSELKVNGEDIKVEVYRMPSADMAFGIYSVNIFRCDETEAQAYYYCQSDYQVQLHKGDYYVNIINNNGSSSGLEGARSIAGQLLALITKESFNLNDYIPEDFYPEKIDKIILIAGGVAMDNYAFEYSHYIEAYKDYKLLLVESEENVMLIFRFENGEQIERFRNSMGLDQFPVCGEKIRLNDVEVSLTDKGDIILHIDTE